MLIYVVKYKGLRHGDAILVMHRYGVAGFSGCREESVSQIYTEGDRKNNEGL